MSAETKEQRRERFRETLRLGRESFFRILGEIAFNAAFEIHRDDLPKLLDLSQKLSEEGNQRAQAEMDAAIPDHREQLRDLSLAPLVDAVNRAAVELAEYSVRAHLDNATLNELKYAFVLADAALAAARKDQTC